MIAGDAPDERERAAMARTVLTGLVVIALTAGAALVAGVTAVVNAL